MNEQQTTAVAKRPVITGNQGIILSDLDTMWRWATYVASSGLAPKGLDKAESIVVAIQMGLEVGLTPMAALQNIAVINGRPTIWGDAQLGIVRSTGELEVFSEYYEVKGQKTTRTPSEFTEDVTAVCSIQRRGYAMQESTFSVADAKRAGLWGKAGPWSQYPARMLKFRARSFGLRDQFGDALRGLMSTEEAQDIKVIDVTPEPVAPKFNTRKKPAATPDQQQPTNTAPAEEKPASEHPIVNTEAPPSFDDLSVLQSQLSTIVIEKCGASFDTFQRAMESLKWVENSNAWTGFGDIPDTVCQRLIGAERGLIVEVKKLL